jgi:hypothetical protein
MHKAILGLSLALSALLASSAGAVIIDDFDTAQTLLANSGTPSTSSSVGPAAGIVGGHRDAAANWTSGPNDVDLDIDTGTASALDLSLGSDTMGNAMLQWDGGDGSISLDPTGLGSVDLTASGTLNALAINVLFDDLPVSVQLFVYTDGGNWSSASLGLPGGIFSASSYTVPFSSFSVGGGSGATFSSVGAIEMVIQPQFGATDLTLDFIESTYVPEPSSIALGAIGLIGLLGWGWKRRR